MVEFDSRFSPGVVFVFANNRRNTLGVISNDATVPYDKSVEAKPKIFIPITTPDNKKFYELMAEKFPTMLRGPYECVKKTVKNIYEESQK